MALASASLSNIKLKLRKQILKRALRSGAKTRQLKIEHTISHSQALSIVIEIHIFKGHKIRIRSLGEEHDSPPLDQMRKTEGALAAVAPVKTLLRKVDVRPANSILSLVSSVHGQNSALKMTHEHW